MNDISLKLEKRTIIGKKLEGLRRGGFVPSVVYGAKLQPISTQSGVVETTKVVVEAGKHTPVKLNIDGVRKLAIIKEIDIDPVKHAIRHVAFHAIKQNEFIVTEVPIVLTGEGESAAEKAGLVILQAIETVEIKAKPADLPKSLDISVAKLETEDDKLTIADIKLPEGVEFADAEQDMELVIANVYEPSSLQAANEAAGGDVEEETVEEPEVDKPEGATDDKAEESSK